VCWRVYLVKPIGAVFYLMTRNTEHVSQSYCSRADHKYDQLRYVIQLRQAAKNYASLEVEAVLDHVMNCLTF